MTKTKAATVVSEDEQTVLDMLNEGKEDEGIKIPFLIVNIASEDDEGNEIPVKTFHLTGTNNYSKSISFRPLGFFNKLIAMKQEGNKWKVTNETVFYNKEQPIDARGGIACGRLLGKAIPESWSEEQRRANKTKANYYGFLFGLVEFPGQEPVLVNFRLPGGKAMQVSQALNEMDKQGRYQFYNMTMKLSTNPKDKSSPHPVLEISPDLNEKLTVSELKEPLHVIKSYVDQHNVRIKTSFQNASLARKSLNSDIDISSAVEDDEIPFN